MGHFFISESNCTFQNQCQENEGNCDYDDQCDSGLGLICKNLICVKPKVGDRSYCTSTNKCSQLQGDCNYDSDCKNGLTCGTDNCPQFLGFNKLTDCCYQKIGN